MILLGMLCKVFCMSPEQAKRCDPNEVALQEFRSSVVLDWFKHLYVMIVGGKPLVIGRQAELDEYSEVLRSKRKKPSILIAPINETTDG